MPEEAHEEKKQYEKPELKKEGELKDITAGGGSPR
jgi:hypothetical protein